MGNTNFGNYVKFIKGTEATWSKLNDAQKDSESLYFISDAGSNFGKLYLGTKLISNGGLTSATSLTELTDVLIKEGITDQSLLIYNALTGLWENKSILDIFLEINAEFKGASDKTDGTSGFVPAPKQGQHNLFLRGDATWANPVAEIQVNLDTLNTKLVTIIGEDINLSMRAVAKEEAETAVLKIVDNAPEQFDTLKEIATWINDNPQIGDIKLISDKVTNLNNIIFGVEDTKGLQAIVSDLQILTSEHSDEIAEIQSALTWQEVF